MGQNEVARMLKFPMPENEAWRIIRQVSESDEGGVRFTHHAKTRMQEREVSTVQVIIVITVISDSN